MSPIVRSKAKHSRPFPKVLIGALVLVALFAVLELTGVTHFFHKRGAFVSTPNSGGGSVNEQKGEPKTAVTNTSPLASSSQGTDSKNNTPSSTIVNLIAPSGDFVSAHGSTSHPITLSASIASVCNTSPGAVCQISFSSNGVTKSLPSELADSQGSAYWNSWTPESIGLSAGTWKITATASSGSKSKSAQDAMELTLSS